MKITHSQYQFLRRYQYKILHDLKIKISFISFSSNKPERGYCVITTHKEGIRQYNLLTHDAISIIKVNGIAKLVIEESQDHLDHAKGFYKSLIYTLEGGTLSPIPFIIRQWESFTIHVEQNFSAFYGKDVWKITVKKKGKIVELVEIPFGELCKGDSFQLDEQVNLAMADFESEFLKVKRA